MYILLFLPCGRAGAGGQKRQGTTVTEVTEVP